MPQTYTYTWTQTRLETIQDQFRYLLDYGNVNYGNVDNIIAAVGMKAIEAIGIYACDKSGLRVIEVELRVDWARSAELSLTVPNISGGLSGWDGKQAPEVKVAGRRFAQAVESMGLSASRWILLAKSIRNDSSSYNKWSSHLNLKGDLPAWKTSPNEQKETLLDLSETQIFIRRSN